MMMQTHVVLDGNDYTINFELDIEREIDVESVVRDKDGRNVWGADWFIDHYGDAVLEECRQFLSENV